MHLMSLTRLKDPQYPHFQDYKLFRSYMKKETYWAHLYSEANLLIQKIQIEGPQLPNTFEEFFKTNLKNHVVQVNTMRTSQLTYCSCTNMCALVK